MKIGDAVELTSGGPSMTVEARDTDSHPYRWTCAWHDDSGKLQRASFPEACLRIVSRQIGARSDGDVRTF